MEEYVGEVNYQLLIKENLIGFFFVAIELMKYYISNFADYWRMPQETIL